MHRVIRVYAGFALAVVTIAAPPLMIVTVPLFVLLVRSGRREKALARQHAYAKAEAKRERERILALKSLR